MRRLRYRVVGPHGSLVRPFVGLDWGISRGTSGIRLSFSSCALVSTGYRREILGDAEGVWRRMTAPNMEGSGLHPLTD